MATSDFAKSIQTDINHYVTLDRINDASFRQKLDPISKNIFRRQNPLELVFEDISTFDAENPIVGSLLREIDINKKQSDSDFIKSLPSQPGKEFEIQKRLDRLKGKSGFDNNRRDNNNNNNNNGGSNNIGSDLFGPGGAPPTLPALDDFLDGGPSNPPPPPPPSAPFNSINNFFNSNNNVPILPPSSNFNPENVSALTIPNFSMPGIENNLFGSKAATVVRENKTKTKTQQEVDDFFYELPDTGMPDLVLGDGLIQTLGTEAEDLFDDIAPSTKKEEQDEILKDLMDQYKVEDIKDTMDKTGQVPESIYFFMVQIVKTLLMH